MDNIEILTKVNKEYKAQTQDLTKEVVRLRKQSTNLATGMQQIMKNYENIADENNMLNSSIKSERQVIESQYKTIQQQKEEIAYIKDLYKKNQENSNFVMTLSNGEDEVVTRMRKKLKKMETCINKLKQNLDTTENEKQFLKELCVQLQEQNSMLLNGDQNEDLKSSSTYIESQKIKNSYKHTFSSPPQNDTQETLNSLVAIITIHLKLIEISLRSQMKKN